MKKMLPKTLAVLTSVVVILSIFAVLPIRPAISSDELPDYEAVDWQTGWAGLVEMPTIEETMPESAPVEAFASTPPVGTSVWDWYLWASSRTDPGGPGQKAWMTLRALAGNVEV